MCRIAGLSPGEAKTDARDVAVIADAARAMPHTLRSLELTDEITAELTVLVGFDPDFAAEATHTSNRIRGLLTQFNPSLERALTPRPDHKAATWLPERHGSPAALDEQTAVVPGTGTLDTVTSSLAVPLAAVHTWRRALEAKISTLLEARPLPRS